MANFEEQSNSRKAFEENEDTIESKKKAIAEAAAAGDFEKIATLAQEAKNLEAAKNEMLGNAQEEASIENEKFDEIKAAEKAEAERIAAEEQAAHEEYIRQTEADEAVRLEELRAKISGEDVPEKAALDTKENKDVVQENTEDIYGMTLPDLANFLKSGGYPEEQIKPNDPDFRQKMEAFNVNRKLFQQAEVKLFDRVVKGGATEEEIKIAEQHAANISKDWSLDGFNSVVPKAWYTNERITNAMAQANPRNKTFIDYVKQNYPAERLLKQYRVIAEDGSVVTYEEK